MLSDKASLRKAIYKARIVHELMMEQYAILGFFLLINFQVPPVICFAQLDSDQGREPQCRSQFDYEYKVVQKIVALENLCEDLKTINNELRAEIQDVKRTNEGIKNKLNVHVLKCTIIEWSLISLQYSGSLLFMKAQSFYTF